MSFGKECTVSPIEERGRFHFGATGFMVYGLVYPILLGTICGAFGYQLFRRGNLP